MKTVEITQLVSDTLESGLPSLLSADGLQDFDVYDNKSPYRATDLELCTYIDFEDNNTDEKQLGLIIQAQIVGIDKVQEYHSVILPFIESDITAGLVGYTVRQSIKSDVWPMDAASSTSFIYYSISFSASLDDCDD